MKSDDVQQGDSTIEDAFANMNLPIPPGRHHCGDQVAFQESGLTYVGSSSRQIPIVTVRYVATARSKSIATLLGIRPTDQSCFRYGCSQSPRRVQHAVRRIWSCSASFSRPRLIVKEMEEGASMMQLSVIDALDVMAQALSINFCRRHQIYAAVTEF